MCQNENLVSDLELEEELPTNELAVLETVTQRLLDEDWYWNGYSTIFAKVNTSKIEEFYGKGDNIKDPEEKAAHLTFLKEKTIPVCEIDNMVNNERHGDLCLTQRANDAALFIELAKKWMPYLLKINLE